MLRAEYSERKNPMIVLETIAVAFSMFSAIPMPQFQWNERNMRFSLCAFPLIGVVIGCVLCGMSSAVFCRSRYSCGEQCFAFCRC